MTPLWAFIVGAFSSGIVFSVVFGAFHLDAEDRAYQKGFEDGRNDNDRRN